MSELYRKSSLEKLSNPEQLDRMIVITSPSFWIAMLGVLGIVISAVLWAVFGRLSIKVESSGIYVNSNGFYPLYSQVEGVITEVVVSEGEQVEEGQVLMRVSNNSIAMEMSQLQNRIGAVEAVTLDSVGDRATSDNKELLDIKSQFNTQRSELEAAQITLSKKRQEHTRRQAETSRMKGQMDSLKTEYYDAMRESGANVEAELEYQEASTMYSQAKSSYDAISQQRMQYREAVDNYRSDYLSAIRIFNKELSAGVFGPSTSEPIDPSEPTEPVNPSEPENPTEPTNPSEPANPDEPATPTDPAEPEPPTEPTDPSGSETGPSNPPDSSESEPANPPDTENTPESSSSEPVNSLSLLSVLENRKISEPLERKPDVSRLSFSSLPDMENGLVSEPFLGAGVSTVSLRSREDDITAQVEEGFEDTPLPVRVLSIERMVEINPLAASDERLVTAWNSYQQALSQLDQVDAVYDSASSDMEHAEIRLDKAREGYIDSAGSNSALSTSVQRLGNEYQIAQSEYQSALSLEMSVENEITSLEQQILTQELNIAIQEESLSAQFNSTREATLKQLEAQMDVYNFNLNNMDITATYSGTVSELQVKRGTVVGAGTALLNVKKDDASDNVVVCYVPLSEGKKIVPGMRVMVCPTTVKEQEYGYIEAEVTYVDEFTTSSNAMMTQLGDSSLVEAFLKDGPVIAVTCQLASDPETASGYHWSSKKGKDIVITEGTMVNTRIVTDEKAPISMIIPLLRETFTVAKR